MRFDHKKKEEPKSVSTVITTLALFIILLSFFIIMNSISTVEEQKASSIIMSIEDAFTGRIFKNLSGPSERESTFKGTGEGRSSLKKLDALFRSEFPAIENVQYNVNKGLFYAELPYDKFVDSLNAFTNEDMQPSPEDRQANTFFNYITELGDSEENPYRIELYVLSEDDPSSLIIVEREQIEPLRRSASSLAAALEKAGIPTRRLTIGLKQGEPDNVLLVIKHVVTENAASSTLESLLP